MGKFHLVIFSIIFFCGISCSQNIVGKIYSNTEANTLYGPVLTSVSISSVQLNNFTFQTTNYLMFRILNGNLTILGDKRKVLSPMNAEVSTQDVFRYFSISLIQKIIQDGNSSITLIEQRNNGIITITNGHYTMEVGAECPPYCN
jgi:hypothetical protein